MTRCPATGRLGTLERRRRPPPTAAAVPRVASLAWRRAIALPDLQLVSGGARLSLRHGARLDLRCQTWGLAWRHARLAIRQRCQTRGVSSDRARWCAIFYRGSLLTGGRPRARHGRVRTSRRPCGHPGARRPIVATHRRPSPSLRPRASGPGTSTAVVAPNMARCTCAGSRAHAGPACPESATASTRRAASRRRPTTRRAGRSPRGGGSRCPSLRRPRPTTTR